MASPTRKGNAMVNFSNLRRLDPASRDIALELLEQAAGHEQPFFAFIYRWMAFNGWMSAVTLEYTDREMIDALAAAPRLAAAHDEMMVTDAPYRQKVDAFAGMWPVLNVRDVRKKLGYDVFRAMDRTALMAACAAANAKQQPVDGYRALRRAGTNCCGRSTRSGATYSMVKNRRRAFVISVWWRRPMTSSMPS